MASYISSIGLSVLMEEKVNGLKYDMFVPERRLLIEINGLKWHSVDGAKERDIRKYRNAMSSGNEFLMFFEDECRSGKAEKILQNRLILSAVRPLRPSECHVRTIGSPDADLFYDLFHYIGPCRPAVSLGAYFDGHLVACMSFSRPTRQSSHPWELVRMASDPAYRVHGIWSKLFRMFVRERSPSSVVSFSDNRLFTGAVYGKMGFVLDGEVRPDYYWTDGYKRHHKSGLRKKGAERASGLTEAQLRTESGLRKIWDLGKKRWVWCSIKCNDKGPH
jgi:hypothetical protein